jgi:hypothetical protein
MSPATIAIIVVIVTLVGIGSLFFRAKRPPSPTFKCARCGVVARHTDRTEQAWQGGAKRLFCDSCHRIWLSAQPARNSAPPLSLRKPLSSNRGCLSVTVILLVVPLAILVGVVYA